MNVKTFNIVFLLKICNSLNADQNRCKVLLLLLLAMSELCKGKFCRAGSRRSKKNNSWYVELPKQPCFPAAFKRVIVGPFPRPPPLDHSTSASRASPRHCARTLIGTLCCSGLSSASGSHEARSSSGSLLPSAPVGLRAPDLLLQSARPQQRSHDPAGQDPHVRAHGEHPAHAHAGTCIMRFTRSVQFQKTCAEVLPTIFLDVHVSQNTWVCM